MLNYAEVKIFASWDNEGGYVFLPIPCTEWHLDLFE